MTEDVRGEARVAELLLNESSQRVPQTVRWKVGIARLRDTSVQM